MDSESDARRDRRPRRSYDDAYRVLNARRSRGERQAPADVRYRRHHHDGYHRHADEQDGRRCRREEMSRDALADSLRHEEANRLVLLRSGIAAEIALRSDIDARAAADQADPRRIELRMGLIAVAARNVAGAAQLHDVRGACPANRRTESADANNATAAYNHAPDADRRASYNRALAAVAADAIRVTAARTEAAALVAAATAAATEEAAAAEDAAEAADVNVALWDEARNVDIVDGDIVAMWDHLPGLQDDAASAAVDLLACREGEAIIVRQELEEHDFCCPVCYTAKDLQELACGHAFCRGCIPKSAFRRGGYFGVSRVSREFQEFKTTQSIFKR